MRLKLLKTTISPPKVVVAPANNTSDINDIGEDENNQTEVNTLRDEFDLRCPRVRGIR